MGMVKVTTANNSILYNFLIRYTNKKCNFSTKIPSDEKLLNDILNEDPEEDYGSNTNSGDEPSYRKTSSLAKFQKNGLNKKNDNNQTPSIGPKYWRTKYRKAYNQVDKGLKTPIDEYITKNMHVIESYNKKHLLPIDQRIKLNLDKDLNWFNVGFDYPLSTAIVRYLSKRRHVSYSKESYADFPLTNFEQRFFALMSGYGSTVAKGPSGCGKSFSLLLSALNLRRMNIKGKGINSLILVKSNSLVTQYQNVVNGLISNLRTDQQVNPKNIVQFLYRSTPEEELQQEDDLTDFQAPHVLVATPQRLLDILSSKGMDFVKINSLSYIAVDDFTSMIDETLMLETKKEAPVVKLMNYVLKLQDYRRMHNCPHPQVILTTNDAATDSLIQQLKEYTKWIDWKKFAPIGKFGDEEDVPHYKYISDKVAVSTVLVLPRFKNETSDKFKVTLYDMKPFEYGETPSEWLNKVYRTSYGNSEAYRKHRNTKWSSIPQEVKMGEIEILCSGLGKLLKKQDVLDWMKDGKPAIVVHSDELNSNSIVEKLSKKTKRKIAVLDVRKHFTQFVDKSTKTEDDIDLYVTNTSSLLGVTLAGLKTIFILGTDAIKTPSNLAMIMGRARNVDGIVPEKEFSMFASGFDSNTNSEKFDPNARTFIIQNMLPDGSVDPYERNLLERSFIINGLVRQLKTIGVEEKWTLEDENLYNSMIGGVFDYGMGVDDDMSVEFTGFSNIIGNIPEPESDIESK